jgi:hypothetical protein
LQLIEGVIFELDLGDRGLCGYVTSQAGTLLEGGVLCCCCEWHLIRIISKKKAIEDNFK